MILIVGALIIVTWLCLLGCYFLVRYVLFKPKAKNIYIEYHKVKMSNDAMYDDYLRWLGKVGGVPVPKVQSPEDAKAESKIKNLF